MDNFRYINEKCPVCGEAFTETDDIVVCPLCGTPHHRECYKKNGECGNMDKHNEGYVWSPEALNSQQAAQPDENVSSEIPPVQVPNYVNPFPNYANPSPFNSASVFPYDISDDLTTDEAAAYIKKNVPKYLGKFFSERSGKHTFNFAAFLFEGLWFAYRKMYKAAAILLSIQLLFICLPSFFPQYRALQTEIDKASSRIESIDPAAEDAQEQLGESYSSMFKALRTYKVGTAILIFSYVGRLAVSIYCGFSANKKYKDHIEKRVKSIKSSSEQNDDFCKWQIINEGGTSFSMAAISFLAIETVATLVSLLSGSVFR